MHAISKGAIVSDNPSTETSLLNLNLILKPETNFIVEPSKNGTYCLAMFLDVVKTSLFKTALRPFRIIGF